MNKILLLEFSNARLFRKYNRKTKKNIYTKDKIFCPLGINNINRDQVSHFIEPITKYQISNMLHVLFNERPVPTLRKSFYTRNEYYVNKANESYLKINTPKIRKFKDGEDFYYEKQHIKKAVFNAWNGEVKPDWFIVKRYIDNNDMFINFTSKLNELLKVNDVTKLIFLDVVQQIRELPSNLIFELYNFITKKMLGKVTIAYVFGIKNGNLINPGFSKITCNMNNGITINNGIDTVLNLDGEIAVPVNDNDIFNLKNNSKGFAKLLDGGLVCIKSIISPYEFNEYGFVKVSEISTEKTVTS